jgi:hypothetical protein
MTDKSYDIFLTHAAADAGLAALVIRQFEAADCGVFSQQALEVGDDFWRRMIYELVDCNAVIILLTKSSLSLPNIAVEVGAALAWDKPIFVLYDGISISDVPEYLQQFAVCPVADLRGVIGQVRQLRQPLTDQQRASLVAIYQEQRNSVDQLLIAPIRLRALADEFRRREAMPVSGKKLVQELIRLRKRGELPRIADRPEPQTV